MAYTLPSLRFAAALAKDLGLPIPNQWLEVADRIKVPFDSEQNFHPEFDGYVRGEWYRVLQWPFCLVKTHSPWHTLIPLTKSPSLACCPSPKSGEEVKQADVVLLGYPVPFPLRPDIRRKNLEIYEAVTSPQGPAMTWVRSLADSLTLLSSPSFPHGESNCSISEF